MNQIEKLFGNNVSFAMQAFIFLWPQVARVAIEGGLSEIVAADIYKRYLRRMKQVKSIRILIEMNKQIFMDYADKVNASVEHNQFSSLVHMCNMYISDNINEKLTVNQIAKELHISRSYLSHVYKSETGESISNHIQHEKISEAKRLLQYSLFSLSNIGNMLGFSSQSHFTLTFRKKTGMTPSQYSTYVRANCK